MGKIYNNDYKEHLEICQLTVAVPEFPLFWPVPIMDFSVLQQIVVFYPNQQTASITSLQVPLIILSAVSFILSQEELVRLILTLIIFRQKNGWWALQATENLELSCTQTSDKGSQIILAAPFFYQSFFSFVSDSRRNDCNPRRIEAICLLSYP